VDRTRDLRRDSPISQPRHSTTIGDERSQDRRTRGSLTDWRTCSPVTLSASREALREREADLVCRLATQAHTPPDAAALAGIADHLDEISPPKAPNRQRNSSACSSKRSACTTAAGSSPPIGFRRRFAQCLLRWAVLGSNQ
jgi:hypothetical protein